MNQKGGIHFIFLFILLIAASAIVSIYLLTHGPKKPFTQTRQTIRLANEPVVEIKATYENPFDQKAQYVNPFSEVKNPFDLLQ